MIEPTRIIAIRHGETTWNVDTRIQGHLDIPLNDTGRRQAARLALALKEEPITAVYASDLARAWETAEYLGRARGLPVTPETGLRERCFGDFEGKTFAEIEALLPEQSQRWRKRDPEFAPRRRRVAAGAEPARRRGRRATGRPAPGRADRAGRPRRRDGRALPRRHPPAHPGAAHLDAGQRGHQPPALDARRASPWSAGPTPSTWTTNPWTTACWPPDRAPLFPPPDHPTCPENP